MPRRSRAAESIDEERAGKNEQQINGAKMEEEEGEDRYLHWLVR